MDTRGVVGHEQVSDGCEKPVGVERVYGLNSSIYRSKSFFLLKQ
jgi:hypothetical protein